MHYVRRTSVRSWFLHSSRAIAVAAAIAGAACSNAPADSGGAGGSADGRGAAPARGGRGRDGGAGGVVVTIASVVEKPMAVTTRVVGNVEASSNVEVRALVTGELLTVNFKEGEDVTAGQLLFTIDPRPFQVALDQAQATLARDTAQAKGAAAQLARSDDLLTRGLVAPSDHEATATSAVAATATVAADQAQVDTAKLQLQYTKIAAPVGGRTGALLVHQGALVHPTDTTPLVNINQVTPVFVSFPVPARLLTEIRAEQARGALQVLALPAGTTGTPVRGTLTFIDNAVDQTTDTIRLKATFPNQDRLLWPGAFVDVTLQLSVNPHAIVVPNAAVQVGQQSQYIYVVKGDQTVEARPVTIAWTDANESVILSGVRAGETVVTDGQLRLTPGARVTIKSSDQTKALP